MNSDSFSSYATSLHERSLHLIVCLSQNGLEYVEDEPDTLIWYAFEFSESPGQFGLFDAFVDKAGRDAHIAGDLAKALFAKAKEYSPVLELCDIIASDVKENAFIAQNI